MSASYPAEVGAKLTTSKNQPTGSVLCHAVDNLNLCFEKLNFIENRIYRERAGPTVAQNEPQEMFSTETIEHSAYQLMVQLGHLLGRLTELESRL